MGRRIDASPSRGTRAPNATSSPVQAAPCPASHSNPAPPGALFARCFAAGVLNMVALLLFNGRLYLTIDTLFAWSRDVSTLVDVALLVALLAVARRRPDAIRPAGFTVVAVGLCLVGYVLCAAGLVLSSAVLALSGVVLVCVPDVWGLVLWLLALAGLDRRQAVLCIAVSGAVGVPIAYAINEGAPVLAIAAVEALVQLAIMALCLPPTRSFFVRLATVGVPVEQEIAHPQAFLPFGHAFYVYIFVFSVAYGFALRCENDAGPLVSTVATLAASLAVAVYAWRARNTPRVDALFVASYLAVALGFMFALMGDARVAGLASALLMAGYICLELLVWVALCAAAARNVVDAIPTICWGTAVGYVGIVVGALLWIVPNYALADVLGGDGLLQGVLIAIVLAALVAYTTLTRRTFEFDATIEGIAPDAPAPVVEVQYVDTLERRCDEIAARFSLTAREADVMRLLAHGRSPAHIQDELGIGYNTVKYHVRNVYAKMGVHSQQELIDEACAR